MRSRKIPREVLQEEIILLKQRTQQFEKQIQQLAEQKARLEAQNKTLQEECKSNSYVQLSRKNGNFHEEDFYHGVIDIPNIKSLLEGWKIKIKEWEQYLELTKRKCTIVAVVGNYNKGKTFMLGKLSDLKTPEGFNVNTQGLSIIYLHNPKDGTQMPIIGLDSKGSSLPLDISSIKRNAMRGDESFDGQITLKMENERLQEKELKDLLRDHEATEDVLQNFIMDIANVIVVMVAELNFEDQKLVNKIKKKFKNVGSKKIIVVHNLYHTHHVIDVEFKINEFIKKAFLLEEVQHKYSDPYKNKAYFVEQLRKDEVVPHIILAKEHSEAGNYFNDVGIKYIKDCLNTTDQQKPIDIIERFYKYLQKNLMTYIKAERELSPYDLVLDRDENSRYVGIRLNEVNQIKLKSVFADEFGQLHVFKEGFQPNYTLFEEAHSDEERYLCLKLECPEKCSEVKARIHLTAEEFKIQIKGKKDTNPLVKSDILANTRQFGEFYVETDLFKRSKYKFDYNEVPSVRFVDGMIVLRWRLMSSDGDDWISTDIRSV